MGILGSDQAEGLRRIMEQDNSRTRIITVTSGKGGVGKSNFALNLAITLANMKDGNGYHPKRVILMDADLGLANINVLLGLIPKANLYHVLKGQKTLQEIIIPTSFGIDLIAGASGLSQLANLEESERINFITSLLQLNYADFLIIDTAAGVSSNVTQFAAISHETIVVTTPEPTSITDAYGVIKSISLENDYIPSLKLVINRAQSQREAEKVAGKVIAITNQFLNIKLEPLGFILENSLIPTAVRKQIPFCVLNPSSNISLSIENIARKILNIDPFTQQKAPGWKQLLNYLIGSNS
ncbi:MAG: MinD/ParA family protein [Brevinemataceae bacterium]